MFGCFFPCRVWAHQRLAPPLSIPSILEHVVSIQIWKWYVWCWQVVGPNGYLYRSAKSAQSLSFHQVRVKFHFSFFFFKRFFASLPPTPKRLRLHSATLGSASVRVFNVEIYQPRVTNLAEDFSLPILSSCLCLTTHSVGGAFVGEWARASATVWYKV